MKFISNCVVKMMGKTHKLFAVLLILVAIKLGVSFTVEVAALFLGAFLIGTYVISPDVDIKLPLTKHRGITHRLSGIIIVGLLVIALSFLVFQSITVEGIVAGVGFSAAWLCHRIGDELSNEVGGIKNDWFLRILIMAAIALISVDLVGPLVGINTGDLYGEMGKSLGS